MTINREKIPISEAVKGLLSAFTPITTPNAIKGVIKSKICFKDLEMSNAPIDPVHLPIINPPQYKAIYFALWASSKTGRPIAFNPSPISAFNNSPRLL